MTVGNNTENTTKGDECLININIGDNVDIGSSSTAGGTKDYFESIEDIDYYINKKNSEIISKKLKKLKKVFDIKILLALSFFACISAGLILVFIFVTYFL
jgi:hypothetical protein